MKKVSQYLICISLLFLLSACGESAPVTNNEPKTNKIQEPQIVEITPPDSSDNFVGSSYKVVERKFADAGFKDIVAEELGDIFEDSTYKEGEVEYVTINNSPFTAEDIFSSDAKVKIVYHTIGKRKLPFSSSEISKMDLEELVEAFSDAGFSDISVSEEYDIDPDESNDKFLNVVYIGFNKSFSSGKEIPYNQKIRIVRHYPYQKFDINIDIDFIGNWFFDKYDVAVFLDGKKKELLKHGEDKTLEFRVKEGDHTISFKSDTDSSIKSTDITYAVDCDIDAKYYLSCHSDSITLESIFVDMKRQLEKDEVKIMNSETEYIGENYKNVVKLLKDLGFSNVKAEPVYDIIFGITEAESVSEVTIKGSNKYRKGDVYKKGDPVVIKYHMSYQEDPEYIKKKAEEEARKEAEAKETAKPTPTPTETLSSDSSHVATGAGNYTTNNKSTYKLGNQGVYAYRQAAGSYYNYWIIDFNEGVVYSFSHGNGSETGEETSNITGDLNSNLLITYQDGEETWKNSLFFKWKNQPDHLIYMPDPYGDWEVDCYPTDLNDAYKLLKEKRIMDLTPR